MLNGNKHGKEHMESSKQKDINIWFIATILLAIALVAIFVIKKDSNKIMGADGKEAVALQSKEAAQKLVNFFTEVGRAGAGPIEGPITLNNVTEESGMYKVNVTYTFIDQNTQKKNPVSPEFYLTRDGKLFIETARIYNLDEAIDQLKQLKEGNAKKPADASGAVSSTTPNINVEPTTTPSKDSGEGTPQPQ